MLHWTKAYWKAITLVVVGLLLALRVPNMWISGGRFWAEEGTIFFQKALNAPWQEALFYSYGGYLNLPVNAATLIAYKFIPLAYAPYCTMIIGLLFQLLPYLVIINATDQCLSRIRIKLLAVALMLLVPESAEVSIQSLHIQFSLALTTSLILCLNPLKGKMAAAGYVALALAPLSGPASIIQAPLFALRALLDRSQERWKQTLILTITSLVQITCFYQVIPGRGRTDIILTLVAYLVRVVIYPFVPTRHMHFIYRALQDNSNILHTIFYIVAISFTILFISVITKQICTKITNCKIATWMFLTSLSTYLIASPGYLVESNNPTLVQFGAGSRYFLIPETLFILALIITLYSTQIAYITSIKKSITIWLLCVGMFHFIFPPGKWRLSGPEWNKQLYTNHDKLLIWGDLGTEYISRTSHPFKYPNREF